MFNEFIDYNKNKDRVESSFTCTQNKELSESNTPRMLSDTTDKVQGDSLRQNKSFDDVSVCQTHNSFEHCIMSCKRRYTEALSSVHDMDVLSFKRQSIGQGLNIESLFASKQNSHASEGSLCPIDMKNEVLDFVETELPVVFKDKKGKGP